MGLLSDALARSVWAEIWVIPTQDEVFCLMFPVWLFYFPKLYVRFLGNSPISPWKVYLYQFTGTTTLLIWSENTARVWFAELITITLRANKSLGKRQIMLFFVFCAFLIY